MENITVGIIKNAIADLPPNMEITFGSSRYSKRPLIFYRFKRRGDNLLQIELNELDPEQDSDIDQIESEMDYRITVGRLKEELGGWKDADQITFGSTMDAVKLFSTSPGVVFSFNLIQPDRSDMAGNL